MSPSSISPTPRVVTLRSVTLGVGHLRRQVSFYGSHFGLRVREKGHASAEVCRKLWGVDEDHDVVTVGRNDVEDGLALRLVRTSDLAARPDFDLTVPGPVGLLYGTRDVRRLYYRLSGAGVEFHSEPVGVELGGPGGGPDPDPESERGGDGSRRAWGRAYDGEYVILSESEAGGTVSPYFGVTEPRDVLVVVSDPAAAGAFLADGLGQRMTGEGEASGAGWSEVMGLDAGVSFRWRHFAAPASGSSPVAGVTLLHFGDGQSATRTAPPDRGLSSLRFDVPGLDAALERAESAGGRRVTEPAAIDHPALGTGRSVALDSPLGMLVELWEAG